jgi:hypothetical protein
MYHCDRSHRIFNDVGQFLKDESRLPRTRMLVASEWKEGNEAHIYEHITIPSSPLSTVHGQVGFFMKAS